MNHFFFLLIVNCIFVNSVFQEDPTFDVLKRFFVDTYIEGIQGDKNRFPCFQAGWMLHHMHHVCIKEGSDGIIVGIEGLNNDWSSKKAANSNIRSHTDWDTLAGNKPPTQSHRVVPNEVLGVKYVDGGTLYANCHQQSLGSTNPAHWMMKLGAFYEISRCEARAKESENSTTFMNFARTPLRNFYMHQCSNTSVTQWDWGSGVLKTIEDDLKLACILQPNCDFRSNFGYEEKFVQHKLPGFLTCFEDIYLSLRLGIWITKPYNLIAFRAGSVKTFGEPLAALEKKTGKRLELPEDLKPLESRPHFCSNYNAKSTNPSLHLSNAKIRIFQRTQTAMLRAFVNINEVVALAQTYTSIPVEIVTINSSTSVAEQIRVFNSFDILISPHGSHLANGIFTIKPSSKVVIEVVPFAFDKVFYSNYNAHLGFASYFMSSGHLTPPQNTSLEHCRFVSKDSFGTLKCKLGKHSYPGKFQQEFWECDTKYQTRSCNTLVDLKAMKKILDEALGEVLCKDSYYVPGKTLISSHDMLSDLKTVFKKPFVLEHEKAIASPAKSAYFPRSIAPKKMQGVSSKEFLNSLKSDFKQAP